MNNVYERLLKFKKQYPMTIGWRLKKHAKIIEMHLNPGEEVLYAFAGQKNDNPFDLWSTSVIALTNKRIIIGRKRLVFGYMFDTITPDMFNDLNVYSGIIWGKITIDTIEEEVTISNLSKKCLDEIETNVTKYIMEEKKKYLKEVK